MGRLITDETTNNLHKIIKITTTSLNRPCRSCSSPCSQRPHSLQVLTSSLPFFTSLIWPGCTSSPQKLTDDCPFSVGAKKQEEHISDMIDYQITLFISLPQQHWQTKVTQFVGFTVFFFVCALNKAGVWFSHRPDFAWLAVSVLRKFRAKRNCAALGWAMNFGRLCRKCKADGSAGFHTFRVNTTHHASAIKSAAPTLTGCSHIPKNHGGKRNCHWTWPGYWKTDDRRPSKCGREWFWPSSVHHP